MIRFALGAKCGASRMPLKGLAQSRPRASLFEQAEERGAAEPEREPPEEIPAVHLEIDVGGSS